MTGTAGEQIQNESNEANAAFDRFSQTFQDARESGADAPSLDALIEQEQEKAGEAPAQSALEQEIAQLRHQVLSSTGRATAFQRKYEHERSLRLQEAQAAPQTATGGKKSRQELLDAIAEDFPELATPFKEIVTDLEQQVSAVTGQLNETIAPIREREQKAAQAEVENLVEKYHPDARQILGNPDFHAWLGSKPAGVQALYNSPDPADAVEMLTIFKAQNPMPQVIDHAASRQERLQASQNFGKSRSVAETNGAPSNPHEAFEYHSRILAQKRGN